MKKIAKRNQVLMKRNRYSAEKSKAVLFTKSFDVADGTEGPSGEIMEELQDAMKQRHSIGRLDVEALTRKVEIFDRRNANLDAGKMKLEEKSIFLEGVLKIHRVRRRKLLAVDRFRAINIFVNAVECRHDS